MQFRQYTPDYKWKLTASTNCARPSSSCRLYQTQPKQQKQSGRAKWLCNGVRLQFGKTFDFDCILRECSGVVCNTLTTTKALSEDDRNSPGFRPTDGNDDDDLDATIREEGEYTQWWFCATNSIVLKWSIGVN